MARNPASLSKFDKMSVLGESAAVYSSRQASDIDVYPRLHQLEVTSLLERPSLGQTWDCRRSVKRPRNAKEQCHNVSAAKKFITEEIVATHLQHLNIASNQSPPSFPSAIPSPSSSLQPPSSQLSTAPPLSFSDCSSLLASAVMSHPLNMRTVASCPRSLEQTREVAMPESETATDNGGIVPSTTRGAAPSFADETGVLTTDIRAIQSQGSPTFCRRENRSWPLVGGGDCMDDSEHVMRRTSPLHKRLACELEEGDEEDGVELAGEGRTRSGLAGHHLKRSKVDLRVTAAAANSLNLDLLPDDPQMMIKSDSDTSSQSSSSDSDLNSLNGGKRWEAVILEDGSDSSDGGAEPGPERPLSLWVSPELQAISSNSRRIKDLLPPSILERYHSPKGMELVPWVGPPSALVRLDEQDSSGSEDDQTTDQQNGWPGENLNDTDVSMEP